MFGNDYNNNGIPDYQESDPYNNGGMNPFGGWGGGFGGMYHGGGVADALIEGLVTLLLPVALVIGLAAYGAQAVDEQFGTQYQGMVLDMLPDGVAHYLDKDGDGRIGGSDGAK